MWEYTYKLKGNNEDKFNFCYSNIMKSENFDNIEYLMINYSNNLIDNDIQKQTDNYQINLIINNLPVNLNSLLLVNLFDTDKIIIPVSLEYFKIILNIFDRQLINQNKLYLPPSEFTNLKLLDLSENYLYTIPKIPNTIEVLNLSHNNFGNSLELLFEKLPSNLKELDLSSNNIENICKVYQ